MLKRITWIAFLFSMWGSFTLLGYAKTGWVGALENFYFFGLGLGIGALIADYEKRKRR